jgi:hypothetical protein
MNKTMSREQAEKLAEELLRQQPRQRDSLFAKVLPVVQELLRPCPCQDDSDPNPFTSPASPLWGVMHRNTDTSK